MLQDMLHQVRFVVVEAAVAQAQLAVLQVQQ
jgi:hypothetical protein